MLRAVLAVASVALTVFALADCIQTDASRMRGIPKWAWIVLIVLIPWAGPLTWLVVGRDRSQGDGAARRPGSRAQPRALAPDDDPDFLRKLDEDVRRRRREREQRTDGDEGSGPSA